MKSSHALLALFACAFVPLHAADLSDLTYTTTGGEVTITDCKTSASGELVIPETIGGNPVTSIGFRAFYECSSLTSITIGEGVTIIVDQAFHYCSSLTSIAIPDSVTSIGDHAFSNCTSLTTIEVGAGNVNYTDVNGVLFNKEKTDLHTYPASKTGDKYNIPDGVTSIRSFAFFLCRNLTSITIPDSVTSIGLRAFQSCRSLTSITIPDSVTSIGKLAFGACSSLTSITIPDSVTSIGERAFYGCTRLTSITIGESVTTIGKEAFHGCSSLTSITIPDGVTSVGDWAFRDCTNLSSITFLGDAPTLGQDPFVGLPEGARVIAGTGAIGFGDWLSGLEIVYAEMEEPFQLEVQISRLEGDQIALRFPAVAGNTYSIQGSSDMKSWELLGLGIVGADDDIQRSFPINGRERFFRILKNGLSE